MHKVAVLQKLKEFYTMTAQEARKALAPKIREAHQSRRQSLEAGKAYKDAISASIKKADSARKTKEVMRKLMEKAERGADSLKASWRQKAREVRDLPQKVVIKRKTVEQSLRQFPGKSRSESIEKMYDAAQSSLDSQRGNLKSIADSAKEAYKKADEIFVNRAARFNEAQASLDQVARQAYSLNSPEIIPISQVRSQVSGLKNEIREGVKALSLRKKLTAGATVGAIALGTGAYLHYRKKKREEQDFKDLIKKRKELQKESEFAPKQSTELLQVLKRIAKATEQKVDLEKLRYMRSSVTRAPKR